MHRVALLALLAAIAGCAESQRSPEHPTNDLEPARRFDDGGCAPPVAVSNVASCADNLTRRRGAAAADRTLRVRGVDAGVFGDAVLLTTGTTTVRVMARSADEALAGVRALRSADGRIGPDAALPAPDRERLRLGCRFWRRGT